MARILWIDDRASKETGQQLGFDALMWFVKNQGHNLSVATEPQEIQESIGGSARFDLVILDILMEPLPNSEFPNSRYGGLDVLGRVGKGNGSRPYIIVLSVMDPEAVTREATHRGIDLWASGVRVIVEKGTLRPSKIAELVDEGLSGSAGNLGRKDGILRLGPDSQEAD